MCKVQACSNNCEGQKVNMAPRKNLTLSIPDLCLDPDSRPTHTKKMGRPVGAKPSTQQEPHGHLPNECYPSPGGTDAEGCSTEATTVVPNQGGVGQRRLTASITSLPEGVLAPPMAV